MQIFGKESIMSNVWIFRCIATPNVALQIHEGHSKNSTIKGEEQ